jgi:hypothetical protein
MLYGSSMRDSFTFVIQHPVEDGRLKQENMLCQGFKPGSLEAKSVQSGSMGTARAFTCHMSTMVCQSAGWKSWESRYFIGHIIISRFHNFAIKLVDAMGEKAKGGTLLILADTY